MLPECLSSLESSLHSSKGEKLPIEIHAARSPFQQGPLGVCAVDGTWAGEFLKQYFLSSTKAAEAGACSREFLQGEQAELCREKGGMSAFAPGQTHQSVAEPGVQPSSALLLM